MEASLCGEDLVSLWKELYVGIALHCKVLDFMGRSLVMQRRYCLEY